MTVTDSERFFILTGGQACGKTTLIRALECRGFAGSIEAGRGITEDQLAIGGPFLPSQDPAIFAELMLCWEMRSYHLACNRPGLVFFDRGVPDVLGYMKIRGLQPTKHLERAVDGFRYNRRVFIAPPWYDIFASDATRKESNFDDTLRSYQAMTEIYPSLGYELIELPRCSLEERVKFVIDQISASPIGSPSLGLPPKTPQSLGLNGAHPGK